MPRAGQREDLSNRKYGRLSVVRFSHSVKYTTGSMSFWWCRCECGTERAFPMSPLKRGRATSCGCKRAEKTRSLLRTHGETGCLEYHSWQSMLARCRNTKDASYPLYGGRGIKVCHRWLKYENFITDMGRRPSKNHTLNRIDNNGNYTPANCNWATKKEQARNRRSSLLLVLGGVTKTLAEWSEMYGHNPISVLKRLKRGWSLRKSLRTPMRKMRQRR